MIRLTSAAVAALLCWLASAAAQPAPTTAGPVPSAVIEELVLANRILNDRGVLDAYGHVSIRHPSDPNRYLMARAIAPGLVTAEDIMEFDLESNPVDQRGRSSRSRSGGRSTTSRPPKARCATASPATPARAWDLWKANVMKKPQ